MIQQLQCRPVPLGKGLVGRALGQWQPKRDQLISVGKHGPAVPSLTPSSPRQGLLLHSVQCAHHREQPALSDPLLYPCEQLHRVRMLVRAGLGEPAWTLSSLGQWLPGCHAQEMAWGRVWFPEKGVIG